MKNSIALYLYFFKDPARLFQTCNRKVKNPNVYFSPHDRSLPAVLIIAPLHHTFPALFISRASFRPDRYFFVNLRPMTQEQIKSMRDRVAVLRRFL
jgi:hypothetical protein